MNKLFKHETEVVITLKQNLFFFLINSVLISDLHFDLFFMHKDRICFFFIFLLASFKNNPTIRNSGNVT